MNARGDREFLWGSLLGFFIGFVLGIICTVVVVLRGVSS